jgi:hypothetical protein
LVSFTQTLTTLARKTCQVHKFLIENFLGYRQIKRWLLSEHLDSTSTVAPENNLFVTKSSAPG